MKYKENYASSLLPVYEVTELTVEEALFALSGHRDKKTRSGMLSGEVLDKYYRKQSACKRRH